MKEFILKFKRKSRAILPSIGENFEEKKKFNFDIQRFANTISNENDTTLVAGTSGDDTVSNYGSNATIDGGNGKDIIINGEFFNKGGVKVSLAGGNDDDTITNSGSNSVIEGGAGNDLIHNGYYYYAPYNFYYDSSSNGDYDDSLKSSKVTINGGIGNDAIYNCGSNVTINGGAGNDFIDNEGSNVTISGGNGNDSITNWYSSKVTISGGAGDDSIENRDSFNVIISGGAGNDFIHNEGSNVTINGGIGNDFIYNCEVFESDDGSIEYYYDENIGSNVLFKYAAGDGNDIIYGFKADSTLSIGGGTYSTAKNGNNVIVTAGSGKITLQDAASLSSIKIKGTLSGDGTDTTPSGEDTTPGGDDTLPGGKNISNTKASTVVTGTAYNDTIKNTAAKVTIQGNAGNDTISNYGSNVTINGGVGNDSVISKCDSVKIYGGDGNDTLNVAVFSSYNWDTSSWEETIHSNATIDGGNGDDFIINHNFSASINSGADNDTISNYGSNVTINGGTGNDSIQNLRGSNNVIIYGGTGNDTISNQFADNVTINAGSGEDRVYNYGSNVLVNIDGGAVTVSGSNVTLSGSEKNDTLTGDRSAQVFRYSAGGGNDLITNYSGEDTIHIALGKIDSYSFDGGDLIFHVGDGSLRLKNMTNHAITVTDSLGNTTTQIYGNGYSPQQVIKNFVKSSSSSLLNSKLKLDEAIKLCSPFNSLQEVINKMVEDCRTANDAEIFLRDYCGIITENDDNGSATGWDAGGLEMKHLSDLMPSVGDTVYPDSTTFTKCGVTIKVPEKDELTQNNQSVVQAFYSWWAEDSIKLIEETYGMSFSGMQMKLYFFDDPISTADGLGGTGGVGIHNRRSVTSNADSRMQLVFAHEMTHVAQCYIFDWSQWTDYMTEGMANLTEGDSSYYFANDPDKLAYYLDPDKHFRTTDSEYQYMYGVGYMFWRYLMKQASDSYDSLQSYVWKDNSKIEGTSNAELLTGNASNMTITAGNGADTITFYGKNSQIKGDAGNDYILLSENAEKSTVYGGVGDDNIVNKGAKTTIEGGAGNDTIHNWSSNVSISGGEGNDIIYTTGENVTLKGGAGKRSMSIGNSNGGDSGENVTVNGGSGDDVIYSYGYYKHENDSLILTPKKKVLLIGGDGNDYINNDYSEDATIEGGAGNDSIENYSDRVKINGGAGDDSIENHGDNVTINGGAGDDSIENMYGSNVTIIGGAGDDTICNWNENSVGTVYEYKNGDGNDLITGFRASDTLIISGTTYSTAKSGYNVIVTAGSGKITLSEATFLSSLKIVTVAGGGSDTGSGETDTIPSGDDTDTVVAGGWATITSAGNSTVVAENMKSFNGTSNADTIQTTTIQDSVNPRTIKGNGGADKITIGSTLNSDGIKSSKVTVNGGAGNDTIDILGNAYGILFSTVSVEGSDGKDFINIYGGVDGIHPSKISIGGGTGDDTIKIFGGNNGIHGGIAEAVSNKTSAYIDVGDGNDKIIIGGEKEKGIDLSKVTIKGGKGNDLISISGGQYGIGGWSNAGGSTVYIDGGAGTDTISINSIDNLSKVSIVAGSGDVISVGSGSANYKFDSTSNVTINGATFKSSKANTSASLTTSSNSITIGSSWNGTIGISNGKTLTDIAGSVISSAGSYSIVNGKLSIQGGKSISNTKASTVLTGTSYADTLKNTAKKVTINGLAGNDTILNDGASSVSVNGGASNDSIYSLLKGESHPNNCTLIGGDGNDTIWNDGEGVPYGGVKVLIDGGNDDDNISNDGENSTILGGNGNDVIYNWGAKNKIDGGDGNDVINNQNDSETNTASKVTITGGTGNDTIYNGNWNLGGSNVSINGGEGADLIHNGNWNEGVSLNGGDSVTILGGEGNDTIFNYKGIQSFIDCGTGNDSVYIDNGYLTITGGDDNDTIDGNCAYSSVNGGSGNDKINIVNWNNATVNGGTGDDTLYGANSDNATINGHGILYQYSNGDGNDVIYGFNANSTLSIGSGTYSTTKSGNDVIVTVGDGKITMVGAASLSPIIKGTLAGGKNISNTKASTLVTGTAYNDTIKNTASKVTIQGGDGKDKISLTSAAKNNVILGGAGNDSIYSSVTSGVLYKYTKGDGNDYIKGWTAKDTLTITGGAYKTSTTGSNVLVSITGGEKITLAGAKGKKININPSNGKNISNTKASTLVAGTAYNDTIKNTAAKVTIQGNAGADRISLTSAAKNNVIVGGAGNDSIYSSVTSGVLFKYAKGDGNDYIKGWTAKDTLTITGGAYKTSVKGSDVIVSVTGGEKITLVGAKGKVSNIKPSSSSTSKLIDSDVSSLILFDDDNFVTDSAQLDSVTQLSEANYSVGKVTSLQGYDVFAQDSLPIATFYDNK